MKSCRKCGEDKPEDAFTKSWWRDQAGNRKYTLRLDCKPCENSKKDRKAIYRALTIEARLIYGSRNRAQQTGIPHNLTAEDIIIPDVCPALGIPLIDTPGTRTDNSPSLDKIIPSLGYVRGNVAVISWRANRLKNDASPLELERLAAYCKTPPQ